ncbi:alpha/beta hydrolase family protein [Flavobacterium sp.]|jgi:pimeloyl-ACP methyl ester carboxylesterase|uniref:alpha/beta hydrolase family protein n=1 Tax=Flavobacterium sp. TaxID=239 RepID=UPI0037BF9622
MKKIIFFLLLSVTSTLFAQDISGSWTGILDLPTSKLPLVFHFTKTNDGYIATMDSPNQGAKGIPVNDITFINQKLSISIAPAAIKYTGKWTSDTEITGTFEQGTFATPLILTKGVVEIKRPQEPVQPYPYYSENVQFMNSKENISFGGTLSLPKKEGKFPAVILISGSGQQNRDSEILGHKPFLIISDYLTRNGIAVLRYDDRGVGESNGNPMLATSADFATDAKAAIEYLRTRKEIDAKKIGVIGHSEGGMIAPMLAATDKNIAFLVLLAGTGVTGDVLLIDQNNEVGKQAGMSEEELNASKITNQTIYNILKEDVDLSVIKTKLTAYFQSNVDKIPASERPTQQEIDKTLKQEVDGIVTPWLRYFISYNPKENLKKVKCPVLVLNGEKDIQVTADLNTKGITEALKEGGNKKVTLQIFPGLNHLFQHCTTCKAEEYSLIDETFSTEVLKTMSDWIQKQVK